MGIRKRPQRCTANAADGSRCGKWCAPGEVVCAKHRPNAPLTGVIAAQDSDDPLVALKRLTKHSDPAIRLRAVNAYLDRLEKDAKGCPRCAANVEKERDNGQVVAYASPSQRAELRALVLSINTIKSAVREYIAQGGQPHDDVQENSHASVSERHQPTRKASDLPAAPDTASAAPRPDEQVMVWKDGALRPEPRSAREWEAL